MLKITNDFIVNNPRLVTKKQSIRYPDLFVVKYNNKVFYDNLWTPELMEARGLIVDNDFNVIVKPFDKIFNFMENETTCDRDKKVLAVEKRNGFLGVMSYHPKYGWIYSTTGSLDSGFADLAKSHLKQYEDILDFCFKGKSVSLMFEICDSVNDPHIIKEEDGEYLIGCNFDGELWTEHKLDNLGWVCDMKRPSWKHIQFDDLLEECKISKIEGYVVRDIDSDIPLMKIKTPYYLICKFLGRLKQEKLDDLLVDSEKFKKKLKDEEFFILIDLIKNSYSDFTNMDEQDKMMWLREQLEEYVYV